MSVPHPGEDNRCVAIGELVVVGAQVLLQIIFDLQLIDATISFMS